MPTAEQKLAVIDDLGRFQHDPLGYVLYAFPWGFGPLKEHKGPRKWQRDTLKRIGEQLKAGGALGAVIQEAIASGHGIGKSALVSWIILWAMSTFEDTRGVVTASTDTQLRTKTWPEVTKWHRMAINDWMFVVTATALYSAEKTRDKTWRVDAVPWSEHNTESFAGLHNEGRRILVVYDEASSIADTIWEVTEGALTDARTEIIWCAFGNPTRNTGRFKECFNRFKHRWGHHNIDSRTVEGINLEQAQGWVDDWGEDSDFVRVRVRGEFPKASSLQFISEADVERARNNEAVSHMHEPLIMGVDVARFGDDQSVIALRRGRDWRTWNQAGRVPGNVWKFRQIDTMQLAARVCEIADEHKVDAIFVDGGGIGGAVIDRLRALHRTCVEVQFGAGSDTSSQEATGVAGEKYANKRAEIWGTMRGALKGSGMAIPDDAELAGELCAVEYAFNSKDEIQLEKKADMKKRGLASPDIADAFALTYAYPVTKALPVSRLTGNASKSEYDPYE